MTDEYQNLSPLSKDKKERFQFWVGKFQRDIGAECYKEWVKDIQISRHFRENRLKNAMAALGASSITNDNEYWYHDCGVNRIEDFHLGRMLMSQASVKVMEDTPTGSIDTDVSKQVADVLNDMVQYDEFIEAMEEFGGDYITDGTSVMVHRADASLDPKTGAPKVRMEYADTLEFVFDSHAKSLKDTKHRFRIRRRDKEDLEMDYDVDIEPDEIAMYYIGAESAYAEDYVPEDKRSDFLEVQFYHRRRIASYIFPPELMEKYGVQEAVSADEFNEMKEMLFAQVSPEEWVDIQIELEAVEELPHIVEEYYYDCFAGGESLLDEAKPMVWDRAMTPDGWAWTVLHHKRRSGTPYGMGIVHFQRDKLLLRLMTMTIAMRAISRYKDRRVYINSNILDTVEQERHKRGEGGDYYVNASPKEAEWSPHDQAVDTAVLQFIQYIDQNIRDETGVTLEQTGTTPFAGAPAAAISMLQQSGNIQLTMRLDKFFRTMQMAIRKHYVLMREYQGLLEIPDAKLEISFDDQTQQDKDNEGMKASNLYQMGLLPGAEVLEKNGYSEDSEAMIQQRQLEDLGRIVMQDEELAQIVQMKMQQTQEGQGQQ